MKNVNFTITILVFINSLIQTKIPINWSNLNNSYFVSISDKINVLIFNIVNRIHDFFESFIYFPFIKEYLNYPSFYLITSPKKYSFGFP